MATQPFTLTAADLDRRVTIETCSTVRGATYQEPAQTWAAQATVWAQVRESSTAPGTTDSATEAAALYARPMKVRMRWRDGLDKAATRLRYKGRLLRITGTAELGRREWLELACEEWAHD